AAAIMVTVPTEDLRAAQGAILWKVLGFFLALTVVLVAVNSFLFTRLVSRRVGRAAGVMEQVAAQPTAQARVTDHRSDEIGAMAQAFNRMADSLRSSHLLLEQRVSERTAALQASEARFRKLIDNAADAVFVFGPDNNLVDVNQQACDSLKYTRA